MRHQLIPITALNSNKIQAASRTSKVALKTLLGSIRRVGLLAPPLVNYKNGKYTIIDGHRRVAACKELGHHKIPCVVYEMDNPEEGFNEATGPIRPPTGREWLEGWARSENREVYLNTLTPGVRRSLKLFIFIFGSGRAEELGLQGRQAPSIVAWITAVDDFLSKYPGTLKVRPHARQIGEWMIKHGQQNDVRRFLASVRGQGMLGDSAKASKLGRAILSDRPLFPRID
jgi:hypothetical protein